VQTVDSQMVERSPTEGGGKEKCTPLKHTRELTRMASYIFKWLSILELPTNRLIVLTG
jgi:hypothetical protein